jgi:hypothetical protein
MHNILRRVTGAYESPPGFVNGDADPPMTCTFGGKRDAYLLPLRLSKPHDNAPRVARHFL